MTCVLLWLPLASAMEEPSTNNSEMEGASTSEMEGEERLMEAEQQNAAAQTKEKKWKKKSKTEFDISLPARHLVSSRPILEINFNLQ